ncbi:hypothetical protein VNI00_012314 [Paramarasmius palmivorus]|uniref:Uncharacterized protein n=1 Tax=Paramarasmius palmivorus TaxID=297713 RepID=A0AAW0C6Y4_9AGAR
MSGYTRIFASPVSRDGFFHDGRSFYVEITNGNRTERVERTGHSHLYDLLTWSGPPPPLLTKKGTIAARQPLPHKDPNAQFYCGQLVHYGLKQFKTKEPAKKHLLAAFGNNRNGLKVPEHILKIESELEAEFRVANIAAEKAYNEEKRNRKLQEAKRQAEQRAKMEQMLAQVQEVDSDDDGTDSDASDVVKVSKKDIKDAIKSMPETELRKIIGKLVGVSEVEEALRSYVIKSQGSKKRGKGKQVQGSSKKRKVQSGKATTSLDTIALMGRFEVVAPLISEQWGSGFDNYLLRLCPSSTSKHLWGGFNFGIISGVIRSSSSSIIPNKSFNSGLKVNFQWRGREQDGETTFSDNNTGHIMFLGQGVIKGRLQWGGYKVEFSGRQDEDTLRRVIWHRYIRDWKREWRGYNANNYERECRSRWGSWAGEATPDPPADSDTSAGGEDE